MKKVYVYPTTHWDYEWYFTNNESVIQLIYHMDEVIDALENEDIKYYHLDGQMCILEEYLKFMPSKKDSISKLVKEGKLIIGPWYTQTDELIIAGESIVRNLYYGMKSAESLGGAMKIGYIPDSFGQSKDMPKILNGFNIKRSVFWRGISNDHCRNKEFIWRSEDGSEVTSYNIKEGYFYGGNLIYNDDIKQVEKTILDGSKTDSVLLSLGGDQRYVDFNLKERIKYYNDGTENNLIYEESSMDNFFNELEKNKDLKVITDEFIEPSNSKIHHSIYATRYDHKYLNDKIERRLIYQLEPLMVMAQNLGLDPKIEMLEEIWKRLLMNHAHDSACGCNSDKTNRSILNRLKEADELSYSALDYITRKISESLKGKDKNDLMLFNTLPKKRDEVITIEVTTKGDSFKIVDSNNEEVNFDVLSKRREYSGSINKREEDNDENLYYYVSKIAIKLLLEPTSITKVKIVEEDLDKKEIGRVSKNTIEDSRFKVEVLDGSIKLTDKNTGDIINDFITIEDMGDDGDTYDYSPPEKDDRYYVNFKNSHIETKEGELYKELIISGKVSLPIDLNERENNICSCENKYSLKIILKENNRIDCHLTIDNTSLDHRMRAIINSNVQSKNSIADTPFGFIRRDNNPIHMKDWKEIGYKEEPTPIYPMIHYVGLEDKNSSMVIYGKGIKEYEILENSKIAITLFRGIGYLGKPDLIRRPGKASGNEFKYIETPDSQLLGEMKFKFSILFAKEFNPSIVMNEFEKYAISVPYYQIQDLNQFTNTLKYFVMHPLKDKKDIVNNLISMEDSKVIITAILPINKNNFIIRLLNPMENEVVGSKLTVKNALGYNYTNLNGENISEELPIKKEEINLNKFNPGEIKTIKVRVR